MTTEMAQVLLTHSYFLRFDPKEFRAMMPYPPLGTLYAASYLREKGFRVALHDVMFSTGEAELQDAITHHRPGIVVIYDDQFNYLTKMCLTRMREAAFAMTGIARAVKCTVIIFSSDAADHLDEYFAHGADYVICGEAEDTLGELVSALLSADASAVTRISGIAYMRDDKLVRTSPRRVREHLDGFPFPAWDLIDLTQYRIAWRRRHGYFSLNLVTTRGCPFHCNWCAKPIYGQVYHTRSPENVVEEMLWLQHVAQPDHLWFADDIFGLTPGWVAQFQEEVVRRGAHIPFKCLSRVDLLLKGNTVQHLKAAGCQTVWVGAESGSQRILDAMEKGTKVDQIHEATSLLHQNGIRVGFFLQYGYPGETWDDIEKTLAMVRECRPDEIGISVSYPLPGTPFYQRVVKDLEQKQNWTDSGDLDMMYRGSYQPDFYRALHTLTHKKFRIWQARDMMKAILVNPAQTTWTSLLRIAKSAYHFATLPRIQKRVNTLSNEALPQ
jgi:anaerobic magnesium-protoporphyrin IX monomethyl ester cyclase